MYFFCIFLYFFRINSCFYEKANPNQISNESNIEWIKSRMNQILNESNLEWIKSRMRNQISISMRHLSNAYDIYGEFHLRHLSRITMSAKYAEILSGFWGFCFQDTISGFYLRFRICFKYTLWFVYNKMIVLTPIIE